MYRLTQAFRNAELQLVNIIYATPVYYTYKFKYVFVHVSLQNIKDSLLTMNTLYCNNYIFCWVSNE